MISFGEIKREINSLLERKKGKEIAKGTDLAYKTVEDLKNGKLSLQNAKLRTIESLYNFAIYSEDDIIVEESNKNKKADNIYVKEIDHTILEDEVTTVIEKQINDDRFETIKAFSYIKEELKTLGLY